LQFKCQTSIGADGILDVEHRHSAFWGGCFSQFSYHMMYRRAPRTLYPELVPKILHVLRKFEFGHLLQLILGRDIICETGCSS